jgi:hypothetical protein
MGWMMSGLEAFLRKPAQGTRTLVILANADRETLETGLCWCDQSISSTLGPPVCPSEALDPRAADPDRCGGQTNGSGPVLTLFSGTSKAVLRF